MMAIGKHRIKNFMTLEYEFTGIRIIDQSLIPVDWSLKINLVAANSKGQTRDEIEANANLTYQKIYFWLDTNLPSIILVNAKNEDDLYIANLSSNIMLYCPGKATDDMMIQLLHSKVSALAEHSLVVGEMELKGSDTTLRYTFDCPDGEYKLPPRTADYYTEGVVRDEFPWWSRDDGFCFEFAKPEGTEEDIFADIIDPMDEFHNVMTGIEDIGIVREPARIIQTERWQPKKV
jgi:hypothetical protein